MSQSSREIVTRCLTFEYPERMPRDMWLLPWAESRHPDAVKEILTRFPGDFVNAPGVYQPSPRVRGDAFAVGEYTDEWGCVFANVQEGVIGEVKSPMLPDIGNWGAVSPPYEILPDDSISARDTVNKACAETDMFVKAACCPRPWERYQFIRGTLNSLMDVMTPEEGGADLLQAIHEFYLKELEFWVSTDVDAIMFMDDWGSQQQLLIPPGVWREMFKPLYRDYCELAQANNKFVFMHSDGCISEIYQDLIGIGVDALNSQLFVMDMAELAAHAKGRITFWGEIDRQHVLPSADPQVGREAVREVAHHLYDPRGGIIAQFEFGPGADPGTATAIFEEWDNVQCNWRKTGETRIAHRPA